MIAGEKSGCFSVAAAGVVVRRIGLDTRRIEKMTILSLVFKFAFQGKFLAYDRIVTDR